MAKKTKEQIAAEAAAAEAAAEAARVEALRLAEVARVEAEKRAAAEAAERARLRREEVARLGEEARGVQDAAAKRAAKLADELSHECACQRRCACACDMRPPAGKWRYCDGAKSRCRLRGACARSRLLPRARRAVGQCGAP